MENAPTPVEITGTNGKYQIKGTETKKLLGLRDENTNNGFSSDLTNTGSRGEFSLTPVRIDNTVHVLFEDKLGSHTATDELTGQPNEQVTLPEYKGTYEIHEFVGWSTEADVDAQNEENTYAVGAEFTLPDVASVTLYAVWSGQSKLTFNKNGGNAAAPDPVIADPGTEVILPEYAGTRSGYTFNGWAETTNLKQKDYYKVYKPGEKYELPKKNVTLYAIWFKTETAKVQYSIRLDGEIPYEPGDYPDSNTKQKIFHEGTEIKESKWIIARGTEGRIEGNHLVNAVTENVTNLPTDDELRTIWPSFDSETQYVHWYVMKYMGSWHIDGVVCDRPTTKTYTITYKVEGQDDVVQT
jgi:uncharacterized repeat protein (TIGR02543 family)